jgi:hypothetical protein
VKDYVVGYFGDARLKKTVNFLAEKCWKSKQFA